MTATKFCVGVILSALCLSAHAQENVDAYSQKTLLKSWALSHCLAQVYADPTIKADANATASAYLERGHQGIDAYEQLSTLADKYASKKLSGSVPSEFNTMKCINMLNSDELDRLVDQLLRNKSDA